MSNSIWLTALALAAVMALAVPVWAGGAQPGVAPAGCEGVTDGECWPEGRGEGRPCWYRMILGAQGMGYIRSGSCSTANGCQYIWPQCGHKATFEAFPAPGHKFIHWTTNGSYAGTANPSHFGLIGGLKVVGVFQ